MPLGTPKHRATLWVLANAAWIAVSPAAALYFDRQQRNRGYPGRVSLRTSGKGLGSGKRLIGVVGLIFAISCSVAAVWALREDAGEASPVFFTWSYITLAMRAAYLAAISEPNT